MKFSSFALSALAAVASAAPFVTRGSGSEIQDLITGLESTVKQHTASMNSIVAALPHNANAEQKQAATESAIKDIKAITSAFHTANAQVAAARQPNLGDLPHDVLGQLNGQPIILAKLLIPVVEELNPALESVLLTLSLGEVYVALQPLLDVELPTLVVGLSGLVQGLLTGLSPLLAGLGGILGPLLLGLGL